MKEDKNNPIFRQDVTMSINREWFSKLKDVVNITKITMDRDCENYVFQLELTGEENYHLQVRVNLKHSNRWRCARYAKHLSKKLGDMFYNIRCSPTSNNNQGKFDYVMKSETRVMGPFSDRPIFTGSSILPSEKLLIWHRFFINLLENYDTDPLDFRTIFHVKDECGRHMKSTFCRFLVWHFKNDVAIINPFGTPGQIASSFVKTGAKKLYFLDLPRSYRVEGPAKNGKSTVTYHQNFSELCIILERIKDGLLVDSFYGRASEPLLMSPPIVIIFSNWDLELFKGQFISEDRLKIIDLSDEKLSEVYQCESDLEQICARCASIS